jgi:hypothetical protein
VRKLRYEIRRTEAFYRKLIEQARVDKKPHEEINGLIHEQMMETEITEAKLYHLLTQRLLQIAAHHLVPRPEFKTEGGAWVQSPVTGRWHLTVEAISELRAAIRKEKKESSEHWRMWPAALTGIIGALIGLVSLVWKK